MTIRLFKQLVAQSIQENLSYRATSIIVMIFGILFFTIEIVTGLVYFDHTDLIGGWTRNDYLLLISVSSMITYLYQTLFVVSHENLAEFIVEGELDYTFLRPVNSFYYYALNRMDFPSIINLVISIVAVFVFAIHYSWTPIRAIFFSLFILLAVWLVFLLNQIIVTLSFWLEKSSKMLAIPEYLMDISSRPSTVYPRLMRLFFSWVIPIVLLYNAPVLVLKNEINYLFFVYILIFLIFLHSFALFLWNKGIVKYQSSN
ncbi:MAG: ABC transporter permease [Enterococcus sp.]